MDDERLDEALPSILSDVNLIEPNYSLTPESPLNSVVKDDLVILNNCLKAVYHGWTMARSVNHICKLAATSADLIEKRRKLMLKPSNFSEFNEALSSQKSYGIETIE